MTFLPFETFTIESSLTKSEVIAKLLNNIEEQKIIDPWNKSATKAFVGYLRGNEFEIIRTINYRNSFLPVIKGKIETDGRITKLTINMRVQFFLIPFMLFVLGFVALSFILELSKGHNDVYLWAGGVLLFVYILTMGGYLYEAARAKDILLDITQGQIDNARQHQL